MLAQIRSCMRAREDEFLTDLGSLGGGCIDLRPGHSVNSFYLIKEGVELAGFQSPQFLI